MIVNEESLILEMQKLFDPVSGRIWLLKAAEHVGRRSECFYPVPSLRCQP